jgi:hypothetical protein
MHRLTLLHNPLLLMYLLNILSALVGFYIGCNSTFPDESSYLAMANSLSQNKFSTWYDLDHYYPETLRMPGYPIFLLVVLTLFKSTMAVKLVQLILYFLALFLSCKILTKLENKNNITKYLFLTLTALNIQLPFYAGLISTEIFSIFLMVAFLYTFVKLENSVRKFVLLGLIWGTLYNMRPAFILLPFFASAMMAYLFGRAVLKKHIFIGLLVFIATTLPFMAWNYLEHETVKVTPLEGGAGVAHMGYWAFKLPANYVETSYWGITIFPDITNPFKFSIDEANENRLVYEREWKEILSGLDRYLTKEDLKYIDIMKREKEINPGKFLLYNSIYTRERESYLWLALTKNILDDPFFYIKTRIYTFFRLYFVGLNPDLLDDSKTLQSKMKALYPFLVTLITVFGSLIFSTFLLIKFDNKLESNIKFIFWLVVFQGVIHVPFAIQSRFMVPIHFLIFIMVSILVSRLKVFERFRHN